MKVPDLKLFRILMTLVTIAEEILNKLLYLKQTCKNLFPSLSNEDF